MYCFIMRLLRKSCVVKLSADSFRYMGRYLNGYASYEFINAADGKRIYNGYFKCRYHVENYEDGATIDKAEGNYYHDRKTGQWIFRRREHGRIKKLKIDYVDGKQHGVYECRGKGVAFNKKRPGYLYVEMQNGHPSGKIKGHFGGVAFNAMCDIDGYPDGKWTVDYKDEEDKKLNYYELWDHGTLKEAYSIDISTGTKRTIPEKIRSLIRDVAYYECMPLEKIMRKGAEVWHGDIPIKE